MYYMVCRCSLNRHRKDSLLYVCTSHMYMYAFPCHFGRPLRSTSEFLQLDSGLTRPDDSHGCSESMRGRGGDLKLGRWAVPASNACYGNCIEEKARQVTGGKNRQTTQIKSALVRIRGWNVLNDKVLTYTHIYLSDLFHRLQ